MQPCTSSPDDADLGVDSHGPTCGGCGCVYRGSVLRPADLHIGAETRHLAGPLAGQAPCQEAAVPAPHAGGRASQAHRPHHFRQGHATQNTPTEQDQPCIMLLEWYDSQMLLSAQQACVLMLACVRKPSQG